MIKITQKASTNLESFREYNPFSINWSRTVTAESNEDAIAQAFFERIAGLVK